MHRSKILFAPFLRPSEPYTFGRYFWGTLYKVWEVGIVVICVFRDLSVLCECYVGCSVSTGMMLRHREETVYIIGIARLGKYILTLSSVQTSNTVLKCWTVTCMVQTKPCCPWPVFNIHVTRSSDQSLCKLIGPAGGSLVISAHPLIHSLTDGQAVDTAKGGNIWRILVLFSVEILILQFLFPDPASVPIFRQLCGQ